MLHVSDEKAPPLSARRRKRDAEAVRKQMLDFAGARPAGSGSNGLTLNNCDIGLKLRELEDERWRVSSLVAKAKLLQFGLPYEGRRAGLIYSWPSIFRAEGIDTNLAKMATRQTHPELFDNLLNTSQAARLLGFQDASSVRKIVIAGRLTDPAFVQFGLRGVYRFRQSALLALQKRDSMGRVV